MTYSVLSATAKLGAAAESSTAVYEPPAFTVPFSAGTRYRSAITQLTDRTVRGTDTDTQAIVQGPYWSDWTIATQAYPDWAGFLYAAMVGTDQFTAGVVTSFAARSLAGAQSISLDAAPPSGAVLMLGQGDTLEYAQAGTPSGSGPYAVPLATSLLYAHSAGDPAQSQASHLFQQDRTLTAPGPPPTISLTTDDGVDQLGWPGCTLGSVRLQVQGTGYARLLSAWSGWPPQAVSTFAEDQTSAQHMAGWGWGITTAAGNSTRGISLDLALTRVLDIIPAACGQQGPYCIGTGPMRASGSYTAIFDTAADLDLYREAIQEPASFSLTQPALQGGSSIAVTMSLSGWTQGAVSLADDYVTAEYSLSGIANTNDSSYGGVAQVAVTNFWQASYS
jgi:hypothetical protein